MSLPNLSFQFSRPFSKDCPNQIYLCAHNGHLIFLDFCGLIYRNNPKVLESDWEIIQKRLKDRDLANGLQVICLRHTANIRSGEDYYLSNYGLGSGHIEALRETGRPWIDFFYDNETPIGRLLGQVLSEVFEIQEYIISKSENIRGILPSEKGCEEVRILLESCSQLELDVEANFVGELYFKFMLGGQQLFGDPVDI